MAHRNHGRSWLAAAVFALSAVPPLLGAAAPAAAADNVTITVYVRDDGFSQSTIDAREGDILIFQLDAGAVKRHTLAWERGQEYFMFDRGEPDGDHKKYGPLDLGKLNSAVLHFYDANYVPGYATGGPHTGVLNVTKAQPTPPPPPPSSTSTTVATTAPSTATTTTTMPPTTATTEPGSVRPFLVPDPAPTTTTTAAPNPAGSGAGSTKGSGTSASTGNKDKGKDKAAAETSTTLAPAPPAALPDGIFNADSLTPSPTTLPDSAVGDPDDETALTASSILSLLDPEKAVDNDNTELVLFIAAAALALLVFVGGLWCWGHRASRYDPA